MIKMWIWSLYFLIMAAFSAPNLALFRRQFLDTKIFQQFFDSQKLMGSARNLKLGATGVRAKAQGQNVDIYSVVVCSSGVQRQRPWSGVRGRSPFKAETLLAFGRSIEAANLFAF